MTIDKTFIKYDSKNNFIIVKVQGEASAKRMINDFNQVLILSEIENCKTVFIDATKLTKLPTMWKLHSVGRYFSKQALKLFKMRIAFAVSDEISNDFSFFNTVLVNRMVNFQTFKNVDDAKDWLLNKE